MTRYCLDTSAYSQLQRGESQVVDLVDRASLVGLPAVVIGELLAGFSQGHRALHNEKVLREFTSDPSVTVIPVDEDVASRYAEIVADLRKEGSPIPTNDIWIAATAANSGLTVLSFDEHFESVSRVGSVVLRPD